MTEALHLTNDFGTAALVAWLNSAWAAILAIVAASLFLHRRTRVNAETRHAIWWAVAGFLVAAPVIYSLAASDPPVESASLESSPLPAAATLPPIGVSAEPVAIPEPVSDVWQWSSGFVPLVVLLVWALGLALQLARVSWSYAWLARLKRDARPAPSRLRAEFDEWVLATAARRRIRLLVSDAVESPVAVGFRDAAVILPASLVDKLEQADLDHVLLHELAHLARRDDWTNLLARVLTGAFAINPAGLYVLRRIDAEREIACDDWVVTATGAAREYAASLSRLVEFRLERRRTLLASGVAGRGSQIGERVCRLLEAGRDFTSSISPLRAAAAIGALAILMAVCAAAPPWVIAAQDPIPPDQPAPPAEAAPLEPPAPIPTPAAPFKRSARESRRAAAPVARAFVPPQPAVAAPPDTIAAPRPFAPPPALPAATPAWAPPAAPAAFAATAPPRSSSLLATLVANGYGDIPVEEIIELKQQGVTPEYLSATVRALGKLPPRQIIQLRHNSVAPEWAARMRAAGLRDLTTAGIIELRNHGADPEQVREIHSLGFGPYTVREAVHLRQQGVRSELFRALKEAGFTQPDLRDVIDARNQGVRPEHFREAAKIGNRLTIRQIIRLKLAGVI